MTINEAKKIYEVKKLIAGEWATKVETAEKEANEGIKSVIKDMYGFEVEYFRLRQSVWNESVEIVFTVGRDDVNIRIGSQTTLRIPTIDENTTDDAIALFTSLLTDYRGKTGGYSVMVSLAGQMNDARKGQTKARHELETALTQYEALKRVQKQEMFYEIVKDGDIVKRNDSEYWKITKITNKCVFAIHKDYSDVNSHRYTKEQFFSKTQSYVDFSEVED